LPITAFIYLSFYQTKIAVAKNTQEVSRLFTSQCSQS